jgi:hypothetical protein
LGTDRRLPVCNGSFQDFAAQAYFFQRATFYDKPIFHNEMMVTLPTILQAVAAPKRDGSSPIAHNRPPMDGRLSPAWKIPIIRAG